MAGSLSVVPDGGVLRAQAVAALSRGHCLNWLIADARGPDRSGLDDHSQLADVHGAVQSDESDALA